MFWDNKSNCSVNKIIYLLQPLHNDTEHINTIHKKYYPSVKNYTSIQHSKHCLILLLILQSLLLFTDCPNFPSLTRSQ